MMSLVVYHETVNQIELAFNEKNKLKIDKETFYILCHLIVFMQGIFKDRLQSVSIDPISLQFDEGFITSDKNQEALLSWLKRLKGLDCSMDDYEFGKLKVDFEEWFYRIGGRDIQFEYLESYLLKPSEVAELLGVSTVTLNEFVKRGFEYINHSSERRIPRHMIPLWKDPVYCLKIQMNYQEKKLQEQTPEDRLREIVVELLEFQLKYKTETSKEAFEEIDENSQDSLADYYEWEALEEEYQELKKKLLST